MPLVVIVGAPNVGKSTLFNRLVRRRHAIVTAQPGMTRDRLYGVVDQGERPFRIVDTGGLTPRTEAPFAREIERQAEAALGEAALVLFVVDARAGATALDREIGELLRRRSLPLLLIANKVDTPAQEPLVHQLHELGLGDPLPVSAEHGLGLPELLDRIEAELGQEEVTPAVSEPDDEAIRVAIVGRPNVGKSSLLNVLLGEERVLVSELPGTTRDAVDTLLELEGRRYVLVDTAGLRRRGRPREAAERYSVNRAQKSIERADVVVLVIDASEQFAAQDAHIAGYVQDARRPMIVAVNKWDLIEDREQRAKDWTETIRHRLRFAKEVPLVLISARTGQRVLRILDLADELHACAGRRVPTGELNRWLQRVARRERGAPAGGGSVNLLYATQTGVHPLRFVLFCSDARRVHFSLRRQLTNSLRETFGLGAAPIQLHFRSRRGP